MNKEEMKTEALFLGSLTTIVYEEHYVPNCKGEPIPLMGFFLTDEFFATSKNIPKEVIADIKVRAKKISGK
jgi:hypothetical protein